MSRRSRVEARAGIARSQVEGPAVSLAAGAPGSLAELFGRATAAGAAGRVVQVARDGGEVVLGHVEVREGAERVLGGLRAGGARPGEAIILQLETAQEFVPALWACILGGLTAVPAAPAGGDAAPAHAGRRLRELWTTLGRPRVVAGTGLADAARGVLGAGARVIPLAELAAHAPDGEWHASPADAVAVLLLSSGTTGRPKLIRRTHHNLLRICQSVGGSGRVTALNWLPLDHNAGITGSLVGLAGGEEQVHLRTRDVLDDPARWLDAVERYRVTHTGGTNYSLGLLSTRLDELPERSWDLSCLESLMVTAEPVVARTVRAFMERAARHGLRPEALRASYAMSETGGITRLSPLRLDEGDADGGDAFVAAGTPYPGIELRIVDGQDGVVPEATEGRIQVRGETVTPGYAGDAEQTRASFTADGWFDTGDAGFLRGGALTVTGREKDVLIVNGLNLHSQEVEAAVEEIDGVARGSTAVCAVRVPGRDTDAAAVFLHTRLPGSGARQALRREVRRVVASRFGASVAHVLLVEPGELSRTEVGKLQRAALRRRLEEGAFANAVAKDAERGGGEGYVAPRGELEREICALWAEALGVERVGVHDDFVGLGGHSLLAARVAARVRAVAGVEVPLGVIFEQPTVAELAAAVEALRSSGGAMAPLDTAAPAVGPLPVSLGQRRLWLVDRLHPGGSAYNLARALRLGGLLDVAALERALGEIVRRHEPLRTVLAAPGGDPEQVVEPWAPPALPVDDLSALPEAAREAEAARRVEAAAATPYDLAQGPLFRAALLRLGEREHVLLLAMHHAVGDAWSFGVLFRELEALYAAFARGLPSPLPPLPLRYADYAARQRAELAGDALERALAWWRERLEGAPALLELPTDRPRPPVRSHRGAIHRFTLPRGLGARLAAVGRGEGATLFMTLLAAFQLLLSRYSGETDVVVGTPVAGRARPELEGLIGFFVDTLALRTDLSGDPTFRQLLRRVRAATLGAYAHQALPFDQLVEALRPERSLAHTPVFQVTLSLQNAGGEPPRLPGVRAAAFPTGGAAAMHDLGLELVEEGGELRGSLEYATDLFDAATAARMLGHLRVLLEEIAAAPDTRLSELEMVDEDERRALDEWNHGGPAGRLVHQLIGDQVARTPGAVAVEHGGTRLTYAELDRRAGALARRLAALGAGPEVCVGVCLERGPDQVAALLAVAGAGAAFVPMDPAYPPARLARVAVHAGVAAIVTAEGFRGRLPEGLPLVFVDEADGARATGDAPRVEAEPANAAYVVYTSGSTGEPKGVVVPHAALASHARAIAAEYGLGPGDRVLHFASPAFDVALEEVFPTLLAGATLVVREERAMDSLAAFLAFAREMALTVWNLPSPYWHALVGELERSGAAVPDTLRLLVVGSEAASSAALAAWRRAAGERVAVRNGYGPTEATVTATLWAPPPGWAPAGGDTLPLGRPLPHVRAQVLDGRGAPVAEGEVGELYLGGGGVARGYLGRPAATAERFVPDPHAPGARRYRTGDRVRRVDGVLEFLGRADGQVKVRGYRVEPGEIEAALRAHLAVREAAVLVRHDAPGSGPLVGYVAAAGVDGEALRAHLAARLPAYMVPDALIVLDALPLTPAGKVDRRALAAPGASGRDRGEPSREGVEAAVAAVWEEVLRVPGVGRDEPFLALGGDSLLAAQVVSRLGGALSVPALLQAATVAGVARALERAGGGAVVPPAPVPGPRLADHPLSLSQERAWFMSRLQPTSLAYQFQAALRFRGALDVAVLERSLGEMVRRHEILRTSFPEVDGLPVQRVHPPFAVRLEEEDLRAVPAADRRAEADRRVRAELERRFDLSRAPLVRWRLLRLDDDVWEMVDVEHHIVHDGWSFDLFLGEVLETYRALAAGGPSPLPAPALQFVDYAAWQRTWLDGPEAAAQLAWWKTQLHGAPPLLELPTDRPRPPVQRFRGAVRRMELSPAEADRVRACGRAHDATLFMTMLAAFAALLHRYGGQEDMCVGSAVANRRWREVEPVIGMFVNTVVLRLEVGGDPAFSALVARARETTLDAYARQDLPFDRVVQALSPERSLSHNPLHQVLFSFDDARMPEVTVPGVGVTVLEGLSNGSAKFDLNVIVAPRRAGSAGFSDGWEPGGLTLLWEYDTDLFDESTVEGMLEHYRRLVLAAAEAPARRVSELPLLDDAGRARVLEEWNRTEAPSQAVSCIHHLIEARAERTPGATAVVFEDGSLTCAELNARANRLAHRLRALGVGPEARVGVCLERSLEMVVSLLAVLKAGGAYVPLDPGYPADRLVWMLADAAPAVLLTQSRLRGALPADGVPVLSVDAAEAELAGESERNPESGVTADALAYVIYTSGSTGRPKGVMNTHRGVMNRLAWMQGEYGLTPADVVLQKTPFSFDVSVWEFFWPLQQGATLVMARPDGHRDPAYLQAVIERRGVTTLHFVPSMLQPFLEAADPARCATLARVFCSGEALPPALVERFHERMPPGVALHNLYGPTEAAVDVSYWACERGAPAGTVPIGRPVWNTRLYVLTPALRPVPVGVAGELYIGGVQVARGYLGRPALTAERFIPDPFADPPGARLYRTGDRVRRRADGALEYLGRLDQQVKIRGFRIEPGEIEAALRAHPAVADAVVADYEHAPGDRRLAAWVVPDAAHAPAPLRLLELRAAGALEGHRVETLPDGTEVVSLNAQETRFVYDEIFERGAYLRHGIELGEDAVVFDAGANIGLFTVRVAQRCPRGRVYAFEPIPPVAEALRLNAAVHGDGVRVLECGLAETDGEAEFTFYPNASILSGRHAQADEEQAVVKAYLLNDADPQGEGDAEEGGEDGLDALLRHRLSAQTFPCRLRTLSSVIREEGVERIDLLKVDVEKSELEVLAGIEDGHWAMIRQVAMEVHDTAGRLERARALLETRGFRVVVEQDAALAGTALHDVYAVRPGASAATTGDLGHAANGRRWHSSAALVDDLRRAVGARLPEYMVPGAFVPIPVLPLTPNGKLDRRRLPAPEPVVTRQAWVAPRTPAEQLLASVWAQVLGRDAVGARENFFELGGHSLLAMRVISRVRAVFGVELPVHALFEAPTVAELAERVDALRAEGAAQLPPVVPVEGGGPFPLTYAQERLWFLDRMEPDSAFYNLPAALRLRGPLDVPALERALGEVVRRHAALRTTFPARDGAPVQVVAPFAGFSLPVEEVAGADAAARDEAAHQRAMDEAGRPFDLAAGPLFRARLLRLEPGEHLLLFCMHHVVSDGWSMGVLFRELSALYAAYGAGGDSPLPELPVQYADYAVWQREQLRGEALEGRLDWWRRRLAGAPALLELPTDRSRPAAQSYRGALVRFHLAPALADRLDALALREGATLYMVLMAGFQLLLGRYAGSDDVVVGSPTAGRTRGEVEELIGFFVQTLVVRTDLSGGPGFREVLERVREAVLGAYQHQEVPFEHLVEALQPERSLAHNPLFQAFFALPDLGGELLLPGVAVEHLRVDLPTAKFDLSLFMSRGSDGLRGVIEYATDLFDAATAARMAAHLERLLEAAAADPALPVARLPMVSAAEREQLLREWSGAGDSFPVSGALHHRFEAHAAARPGAVAVTCGGQSLTYGELNARANRLARRLRARGTGPESRVGLCAERSPELVAGVLAILKAGGAYVPLDPAYPPERLAYMAHDSGVRVVLAQPAVRERVPGGVEVIAIDDAALDERADDLGIDVSPDTLAYVIYTSGSTGRPKGVGVTHGNVLRLFASTQSSFAFGERDVWTLFHSYAFDFSVWEIWGALLYGGRVVVVPWDVSRDAAAFRALLADERVTVLSQTPSAFRALAAADEAEAEPLEALRTVVFGGEALRYEALRGWVDRYGPRRPRLVNMYGITETTVHVTWHTVTGAELRRAAAGSGVGAPIPDLRAYVLEPGGEPAPAGVPGELHVGGAGVARGYLGRPALTAQRFVPDPFSGQPGARLYRSGDRARWTAEGTLEYLGRIDQQVKVRGFRIEPGEIETLLLAHPGVAAAAVVVRGEGEDAALVAYYVPSGGAPPAAAALRDALRAHLPEHMVPAALLAVDHIPLTANGKVDRAALPEPGAAEPGADGGPAAPRTPVEEVVAAIWAEVLRVERVGVLDDFFELGGHSLRATQVVARIRDVLGVSIPLRTVFAAPTVAELAARVEALRREGVPALPPVVPVNRDGPQPLSFAQGRLWFLNRMEPESPFYNVPAALRLRGPLDAAALERALGETVRRHESLRTVITEVDGVPAQRVSPFAGFALPAEDLSALAAEAREAAVRARVRDDATGAFDLAAGLPIRARLLRLAEQEHVLLLSMHHIVSDGWSMGVLFRELGTLYQAYRDGGESPLPPLPVQYADYAAWQREQFGGEAMERQLAYWKARLAGLPTLLELPTDRPRPAVQTYRGAYERIELPDRLLERLRALGRGEGATLFMVILGAFQLLLAKYAGTGDVMVGSPIAGRTRREVEELIGFFVNTLVLRTDLSGDPSFREVLRRVREVTLGGYEHQDVPFEKLVAELQPERTLSHSPLFQVMFTLQTGDDEPGLVLPGVRVESVAPELGTTKFDLTLFLSVDDLGLNGALGYNPDLFDRATIRRMAGHLERVLEQATLAPETPVSRLELMDPAERRQVVEEWNRVESESTAACIHRLFEAQAARTPGAPAATCEGETLSYAELNARANRLARHLARHGVSPEVRVGLCLERGMEMVVSILAVLKAGGAYVPLDPGYPAERLAYILADAGVPVLVTQESLRGTLAVPSTVRVVSVDGAAAEIAAERADDLLAAARPDGLAYVIYTSGSTGAPKGALIEHRNVARLFSSTGAWFGFGADDVWTLFHSYAFDFSVWELWGALLHGGRVVVVPFHVSRDPEAFHALLGAERVTVLSQTPSAFRQLMRVDAERAGELALRWVVFGGEALEPAALRGWVERRGTETPRLVNMYGITETTVHVTWRPLGRADVFEGAGSPIGVRIPDLRLYVLDPGAWPAPVGIPGELYVGGAGVARGYLNRPALTAARFVPDPFATEPGARLYRTGDRVRWLADGTLEYLGRLDQQVKVRGFRIEPGEIEAVLRGHAGVADCVVIVREDAPGERQLVAYLVGEADAEALRAHLRRSLPDYMVPAAFVALGALPLTGNGKLDRAALPAPDRSARDPMAPRTPVEAALAEIWAEVLRLERVGVEEGFFELGGDSILTLQVVSLARRAGLAITPRQLFEHQTIAELATVVGWSAAAAARPAEPGPVSGWVTPTPIQSWFFEQEHPAPWHVNQSMLLEVGAEVGGAALEAALAAVLEHHDALRLRFRPGDAGWEQWHAGRAGIALERVDLSALAPEARDAAQDAAAAERQAGLELERGPIGRAVLFDRGGEGRVLLLVLHHLAVDGVSWRILREDLERACAQLEAGGPVDLGDKGTSYRDWAAALEAYAASPTLAAEAAWWIGQDADGVAPPPVEGTAVRTVGGSRTVTTELGAEETRALLHEVPAAYRTQINDVLLSALAQALSGWTGSPRVRVALEGHGREEEVGAGVDLTRTVGWFTSIYPVVLDLAGAEGPGERLKRVKEQLRAVPRRGIGYGVLRYLSPDAEVRGRLAAHAEAEIAFNYLGQFDHGLALASRFRFAAGPRGPSQAAENRRRWLLEANGGIGGGCLRMEWTYDAAAYRAETVERVAAAWLAALRALIAHCRGAADVGFTPSDFPLARLTQAEVDAAVAGRAGVEDLYPLSPLQEGLHFHALLDAGSQAYQVQIVDRLEGPLDGERFRRAWAAVVARHAILRTGFVHQGLRTPLQRVEAAAELPWRVEDWRGLGPAGQEAALERYLAGDRARGFALDAPPLMRCALFRLDAEAHWLVWSQHHLLMDGWSAARVLDEVLRLYAAWSACEAVELRPVRPYRDFIAWLGRQDEGAAERYWSGLLVGFAAPTPLGVDHAPPPGAELRHARLQTALPAELTRRLEEAARRTRVTLSTVLQGAWGFLLSRYSGEGDVVFGNTVSGRPAELDGVEEMVGLFINTLPVRLRVPRGERLGAWLREVQRAQAEAREYEYAPLVRVHGWSDVPRGTPLFETLFVFENYPVERGAPGGGGLRRAGRRAVEWTNYPLTLVAAPADTLLLALSYDANRLDEAAVERALGHLRRLLEQVAEDPDVPLARLTLMDGAERARVVDAWNRTERPFPGEACIHELFAAQAARTPGAPALAWGDEALTYRELDERANRLARHLAALGVGPERRVGVRLERGLELVVATLAVLKAGGCCVPADITYPAERMLRMLGDAEVHAVVTRRALAGPLAGAEVALVCLDEAAAAIAALPSEAPRGGAGAGNLAYVFYTSGSTGRPKGVMMGHREVVQLAACVGESMPIGPGSRMAQASNTSFDAAVFEIWAALLNGGTVVGIDRDVLLSAPALGRELRRLGITHLYQTAALLNQHLLEQPDVYATLSQLVFGAEAVGTEGVRRMLRQGRPRHVLHEYGPTEATVWCTLQPVDELADDAVSVPIGRPVPNARAYVLDPALNPLPAGVAGELFIGGAGVVRGYLGRPGLTAERFVPDPFAGAGARMYRTGDRAWWLADGRLEFLGRFDEQVKIRGFRIEPGEVEGALVALPGVREARVVVREDTPGDKRLVAYLAGTAEPDTLRARLRDTLPEYMVPQAFVVIEWLPLTPNGKLDRTALPVPELALAADQYVAPRTPLEEVLVEIWAEVLGVARVGAGDDFFALGGHSLLAIQVCSRIREIFAVELPLRALFDGPSVGELATLLSTDPRFAERVMGLLLQYDDHALEPDPGSDPDLRLSRPELAGPDDRMPLEAWNQTDRPFPRGVCIHELFEDRVGETPGAPALVWGGEALTYAALDARANRLAHHLARLGAGPESRVGVLLERGIDLVVSILAILKAGGCYVPLDPEYPAERLRWMLEDSGVRVLLTRGELAAALGDTGSRIVRLDHAAEALAAESAYPPRGGATADNLAYIVYTSGSTGRPKGVMVVHGHVVQLVRETDYVRLGPGDRVAQASNASFDALAFETWGALLNGATLVGIDRDVLLSPSALRDVLREGGITTLYQTTALLNQLSREHADIFAPLREVLFGGEAVDAESVRRILRAGPPQRLLHMYGPTETTAWCSWHPVEHVDDDAATVSVGRPTGNARIYVLDAELRPVPIGVPGEACVGGAGIVRGYLDRPGLTAERFLPDPFSGELGARMYRTGDRLRWKADGRLEFLGRLDEQVKIRGFRIEPGEVESALSAHPSVREARVIVREDAPGEKRLVAYLTGTAEPDALRARLRGTLPEYMVPQAFVVLERLPLTPTGKLDRKALPVPELASAPERDGAPLTPLEEVLAEIWAEVLGVERVGADDDFFALGGHSLLAIRVCSRIGEIFGVELPLRALFDRPRVRAVAELMSTDPGFAEQAKRVVALLPQIESTSPEVVA